MNTTKSKLGCLLGGVMLLATLACNGIAGATSNLPVVQPVEASNSAVTPAPVEAGEETKSIGSGQTSTFDPGGPWPGWTVTPW